MLVDRARSLLQSLLSWPLLFLLLFLLLLLAGCGGGGGDPGAVSTPPAPPGAGSGSLQVVIDALPPGSHAAVRVTGPNNFAQDVTATRTLDNLVPGAYSVAASSVSVGDATYSPAPAIQSVAVTPGATATAALAYASGALTLALQDIGPSFTSPMFVTAPPGDERLFVVLRHGVIRIVRNGTALTRPWLDISADIFTGGEGGLLSMAFDPDFASNGYFYVYYTDPSLNIVVERYSASPTPDLADPTSALTILRIPHPQFPTHFGGQVAFGPDGFLYAGTGDGGGGGDPFGNAQDLDSLLGKMLRVNVNKASVAQPYTIPATNPYVNQAGRRAEIWASGLRNPWRFSVDGEQLYLADVGQDAREEVNIVPASLGGLNYGWNIMEGTACFGAVSCERTGLILPRFEYGHGANNVNGCSITGGYVYRGTAIPELTGSYFYSDFCRGAIKSFFATGAGVFEQRDWGLAPGGQVVSFGRDGAGELYVVSASGRVFRVVRGAAPQPG